MNKYTPCNSKKVPFFNALVAFYESVSANMMSNNTYINTSIDALHYAISCFLTEKKWLNPTIYVPKNLDNDVVNANRPIRRDKVALYNRLVEFMDLVLESMKPNTSTTKIDDSLHKMTFDYLCKCDPEIYVIMGVSSLSMIEKYKPITNKRKALITFSCIVDSEDISKEELIATLRSQTKDFTDCNCSYSFTMVD